MILNSKAWEINLQFDTLKLGSIDREGSVYISEGSMYIPAAIIKGVIRAFIENSGITQEYIKSTFGYFDGENRFPSGVLISNFKQDGECQIESDMHVAISPYTGSVEQKTLYEETIKNVSFSGQVHLRNGGVYPSIMTHQLFSLALDNISIGRRRSSGYGRVRNCKMFRDDLRYENINLNPVECILRECGDKLIREVANEAAAINKIEWRDLERIMAQVFEEIGFRVTLTNGSKDGGKDLILFCVSSNRIDGHFTQNKYYVELKHWRSGQLVGANPIQKLIEVSVRDEINGLAIYSTSGFASKLIQENIGNVMFDFFLYHIDLIRCQIWRKLKPKFWCN